MIIIRKITRPFWWNLSKSRANSVLSFLQPFSWRQKTPSILLAIFAQNVMHQSRNDSKLQSQDRFAYVGLGVRFHFARSPESMVSTLGCACALFDYIPIAMCTALGNELCLLDHSFNRLLATLMFQLNSQWILANWFVRLCKKTPFVLAIIKLLFCNSTAVNRLCSVKCIDSCILWPLTRQKKNEKKNSNRRIVVRVWIHEIHENKSVNTEPFEEKIQPCSGSMYDPTIQLESWFSHLYFGFSCVCVCVRRTNLL